MSTVSQPGPPPIRTYVTPWENVWPTRAKCPNQNRPLQAEMPGWSVRRLGAVDGKQIDELATLLIDVVEGGATVGFMMPITHERAVSFWSRVAEEVVVGKRVLLIAEDDAGICGTVQLVLDLPDNQPHRADLLKMLVRRRTRRKALAAELLRAAEAAALDSGRTLLVLDAVTDDDAARLYERLGWVRVGDIPGYALMPEGGLCGTTYYYRQLH